MNKFDFALLAENLPQAADSQKTEIARDRWLEKAPEAESIGKFCQTFSKNPNGEKILKALFGNSPYLSQCMMREHIFFKDLIENGPDKSFRKILAGLAALPTRDLDERTLMRALRVAKRQAALLIAIADISNFWSLAQVTGSLSDLADASLEATVSHIMTMLHKNGDIDLAKSAPPYLDNGFFILGMGKLGSRELNYSSDIDLIILYDSLKMRARDSQALRQACVRATRDLIRIMDSRTSDGYVFRTDLRLRPDPGATPPAMTVTAAETYYESMGQNWERAAMIKARVVAGDRKLGRAFLEHIRPFIWRKHLDFAAIQDIHSIKRQINARRGGQTVAIAGHDIKLGRGGIREIEFYVQTQQLIWGGREITLRVKSTCQALQALHDFGQIDAKALNDLTSSYHFLRKLEHRLQMVNDKQTQKLPLKDDEIAAIGIFMNYTDPALFRTDLMGHLQRVEKHYARLFEDAADLGSSRSLVFTGSEDDPETIENLQNMGFEQASRISALVRTWHHGRYRATRSERARQILTELTPHLLKQLAQTANPDEAFIRFDGFLEGLPSGIQLFSLFQAYPAILKLVATIMGDAPRLAKWLTKSPILLDSVLTADFDTPCPALPDMRHNLDQTLKQARDFQDIMDLSRRWANDYKFKTGVQLLQGMTNGRQMGPGLSNIAEATLEIVIPRILNTFTEIHGHLPGEGLAVIAFGKLGGQELLPESDLDLVFVYDACKADASDGEKPLTPNVYYIRLCQRIVTALASQTGEGQLFEVDGRLRPAGNSGALATQFETFRRYYDLTNGGEAWTWEYMALTRARVICASSKLKAQLEALIQQALCQKRDPQDVVVQISKMRARIRQQYPGKSRWDIKHRAGGLVDVEFICQYLQLIHARVHPEILSPNSQQTITRLSAANIIDADCAQELDQALELWQNIQAVLRLSVSGMLVEATAPEGLKQALARAGGCRDFYALKNHMEDAATRVRSYFRKLIDEPASLEEKPE